MEMVEVQGFVLRADRGTSTAQGVATVGSVAAIRGRAAMVAFVQRVRPV
jgi:hypothetical protein